MNPVLWWMVQNLVSVCVLVVLVSVACLALRNRPAWRHALWLVVLIKFITPPVVSWPWTLSDLTDRVPPVAASIEDTDSHPESASMLSSGGMESDAAENAAILVGGDVTGGVNDEDASIFNAPFVDNSGDTSALNESATASRSAFLGEAEMQLAQQLFVGLWIVGGMVVLAIQLRRLSHRRAVVRRGSPAPRRLVDEIGRVSRKLKVRSVPATVVPEIAAPFLWCVGWLRVVWPEALTHEDALHRSRGIIAHELAHVRRRDHWVVWLELAAGIIWWWNPLFWFARRRLRESAEMACDAIALSVYDDRREYAEMFLELSSSFETGMPAPALGVSTGTPSSFERRLTMILSDRVSGKLSVWGILLVACIAAVTLPTLSMAQQSSDDESKPKTGASTEIERFLDTIDNTNRTAANADAGDAGDVSRTVRKAIEWLNRRPVSATPEQDRLALYAIEIDTGRVTLVADEPRGSLTYIGSPSWSSDGRQILFDATPSGKDWRKTRLKMLDMSKTPVTTTDLGAGNCPALSPDGGRIAFLLNAGAVKDARRGVWLMDADGSNRRHLGGFGCPKWSPDGSKLLIVGFGRPLPLSVIDVKTGKERPVQLGSHKIWSIPSWAADSKTLVANVHSATGAGIALVDVAEPEQAKVKQILWRRGDRLDVSPAFPVFSAETGRCLFVGREEKGMALYSLFISKYDPPQRLEAEGYDNKIANLALSPDGRYVLFCADRTDARRIPRPEK